MQTITAIENVSAGMPVKKYLNPVKTEALPTPMIYGMHKKIIKVCIWINIFLCALYITRNPIKAVKAMKKLKAIKR